MALCLAGLSFGQELPTHLTQSDLEHFWLEVYPAEQQRTTSTAESRYQLEILSKAGPAECFMGIGQNNRADCGGDLVASPMSTSPRSSCAHGSSARTSLWAEKPLWRRDRRLSI